MSHVTHCSGHNIYAFGIIIIFLVQSPNFLVLLANYPNKETATGVPFWRTVANFWNVDFQPIIFVKTSNEFILTFAKGLCWNLCFFKRGNYLLIEYMMGLILVLTKRFIPNDTNKCFVKYQNIISKNTLKPFLCDLYFVDKQIFDKQIDQIRFYFYIVKGWMDNPINLIWNLEEPVGKIFSTSCVIR